MDHSRRAGHVRDEGGRWVRAQRRARDDVQAQLQGGADGLPAGTGAAGDQSNQCANTGERRARRKAAGMRAAAASTAGVGRGRRVLRAPVDELLPGTWSWSFWCLRAEECRGGEWPGRAILATTARRDGQRQHLHAGHPLREVQATIRACRGLAVGQRGRAERHGRWSWELVCIAVGAARAGPQISRRPTAGDELANREPSRS